MRWWVELAGRGGAWTRWWVELAVGGGAWMRWWVELAGGGGAWCREDMINSSWLSAKLMRVIGTFWFAGLAIIIGVDTAFCSAIEIDEGTIVISSADSAVRKSPSTVEIGGGGGLFSGGGFGFPCSSFISLCKTRQ
jgi:hypothetical protein